MKKDLICFSRTNDFTSACSVVNDQTKSNKTLSKVSDEKSLKFNGFSNEANKLLDKPFFDKNYLNPFGSSSQPSFHDHFKGYLDNSSNEDEYDANAKAFIQSYHETNTLDEAPATECKHRYKDVMDFIAKCDRKAKYINSVRGSKALKKLIAADSKNEHICALFNDLKPLFIQLITNRFGNYFCQELFKLLDRSQRDELWLIIRAKLKMYMYHDYANYCIQILLDQASDEDEQSAILSYIDPIFPYLVKDSTSIRIALKLMTSLNHSTKQLAHLISTNLKFYIFEPQGVCVINKFIARVKSMTNDIKSEFSDSLILIIPSVVNHVNAHYSILTLIEEWKPEELVYIAEYIKSNFVFFASNKYAKRILVKSVLDKKLVRHSS